MKDLALQFLSEIIHELATKEVLQGSSDGRLRGLSAEVEILRRRSSRLRKPRENRILNESLAELCAADDDLCRLR